MPARQTILKLAIIFLVTGLALPATGAIYKWKDENGKTHFTGDITKVPEAFHKPFIKSPRFRKETPKTRNKEVQGKEVSGKQSATEKPAEPEKKVDDGGLTEAHRLAAEAAVNFLKEDISRYEKIIKFPHSRMKYDQLRKAMASATPKKQALLKQIGLLELPLLAEIAGFLQTSIAGDEKFLKIMPLTAPAMGQTQALIDRLQSETAQENQFLEKLTSILGD